jgi:hypothetical protein
MEGLRAVFPVSTAPMDYYGYAIFRCLLEEEE